MRLGETARIVLSSPKNVLDEALRLLSPEPIHTEQYEAIQVFHTLTGRLCGLQRRDIASYKSSVSVINDEIRHEEGAMWRERTHLSNS